jgi:DNA repair exonuclease SbcCD ATPase subunit
MNLVFDTIRYSNILSVGNAPIEVQLNKSPSTLIIGTNGQGKSTFIDALVYCLYGRSVRKVPNIRSDVD